MANEEVFATAERSDNEQIRVLVSDYKDTSYVHIRSFYRTSRQPDWQYGKGVTIPYDDVDALDTLIAGLQAIRKRVKDGD